MLVTAFCLFDDYTFPISGSSSVWEYFSNFSLKHPNLFRVHTQTLRTKVVLSRKGKENYSYYFVSETVTIQGKDKQEYIVLLPVSTACYYQMTHRESSLETSHSALSCLILTSNFEKDTIAVLKIRTLMFRKV